MSRSLVAGVNALFRAKESSRWRGRVLHDAWAGVLAERDPRVLAVRYARLVLPPLFATVRDLQTAHVVRHRAIDELLLRARKDGFEQFVILGAGYDMRRYRFAGALDGTTWIEVDDRETQARKWKLLEGRRGINGQVTRVGIDFMRQPLADALASTPFDRTRPTCFVAEGLIHYLDMPQVESLFEAFAAPAKSRVILSYIDGAMVRRATPTFVSLIKTVREVPSLYFVESELSALGARHRFGATAIWSFADQVSDFAAAARARPTPALTQHVAQLDR